MLITLTDRDCRCNISDFYRNVAKMAGFEVNEKTRFDNTKISITPMGLFEMKYWYRRAKGLNEPTIAIKFAQIGPKKMNRESWLRTELPMYAVDIQEGFII